MTSLPRQMPKDVLPAWAAPLWHEAKGTRVAILGLVKPIQEVLARNSARAIGPRRVTYNLLDNRENDPVVALYLEKGGKDALDDHVTATLTTMRELGLVHPDQVSDSRSTTILPVTVSGPDEYQGRLGRELGWRYRHDRQEGQPQRIEIWTEAADTLPDLRQLGDKYGVPTVSASGSIVWDAVSKLGQRIARDVERPTDILYAGDFDPAGLSIPDTIMNAEIQASRWYRARELEVEEEMGELEAWAAACAEYPTGGTPAYWAEVEVVRVGVLRADLRSRAPDGRPRTTSPVKRSQIEAQYDQNGKWKPGSGTYQRWWPVGENRMLQLEGLTVEEVVARMEDELIARTDRDALDAVMDEEAEGRAAVRARLEGDALPE